MIIAIDVGSNGALAYKKGNEIGFLDFKSCKLIGYIEFLLKNKVSKAIVEEVHAMPKQGVVSMFNFGIRYGEILSMLQVLNIPYEVISPVKWHKKLNIPSKASKKEIASIIQAKYPDVNFYGKKGGLLDGRSDALCLLHCLIKENNG